MKVYSDKLTEADLRAALPQGVGLRDVVKIVNPRKRKNGWTLYLEGLTFGHSRSTNSGTRGAGSYKAATYDDHGCWMSVLFDKDPHAVISHWDGKEQFDDGTNNRYYEGRVIEA